MNYNDQFFELLKSSLHVNPHTALTIHIPHVSADFQTYRTRESAQQLAKGFNELVNGELTEDTPDRNLKIGAFVITKSYDVRICVSYKEDKHVN